MIGSVTSDSTNTDFFFFVGRGFGRGLGCERDPVLAAGSSALTAVAASASASARAFSVALYPSGAAGALAASRSVEVGGKFSAMRLWRGLGCAADETGWVMAMFEVAGGKMRGAAPRREAGSTMRGGGISAWTGMVRRACS